MPRRLSWEQLKESLLSIFGIYMGEDPNRYPTPEPEILPFAVERTATSTCSPDAGSGQLTPNSKAEPQDEVVHAH
jgi:hypothetical protein